MVLVVIKPKNIQQHFFFVTPDYKGNGEFILLRVSMYWVTQQVETSVCKSDQRYLVFGHNVLRILLIQTNKQTDKQTNRQTESSTC